LWQEGKKSATRSHGKILEFFRDFSGKVKKEHVEWSDPKFWPLSS
jgi:hypothetical protein